MVMEILMDSNQIIMANLGQQPIFVDTDYKFSKYCLVTNIDNGKLIFNELTRSLVFLQNSEVANIGNINDYEYLYKNYFLVTEDFNGDKIVDKLRKNLLIPLDDVYLDHPSGFTIFTTTKCNARCFYCYERLGKGKKHMTEATALKVAEYIHKVAPLNKTINIGWFGGEPLYNLKVIDIINNYLREHGRPFTNTMISNGYLFDKDLVLRAKNMWNLVEVQITIDGTENVYNKAKNYIYKDNISPYKKVLNNIAMLLNAGIGVQLRFNIDVYNAEDLKLVVNEIHNRFGNHPKLSMYAWPIFEDATYTRTPEDHKKVFECLRELENTIALAGYYIGDHPSPMLKTNQCMADCGDSVTISPDGDLGVCEHYFNEHFWGHINDPSKKDFSQLSCWRELNPKLDICEDCPLYPNCVRPKMCEEMGKCDEQYKEWRLDRAIRGMIAFYRDYRNQAQSNDFPSHLAENVL